MNQSYWQKTTQREIEKELETDIETDIVIIGGGLSGVALAYQLKDSPYQVIVLEKDELGSHTSGHTTAKVSTLHGLIYEDICSYYDIHQAHLYYQSNQKALEDIQQIIEKENIDCDFQVNNAYIYTDDPQYVQHIENVKSIFQKMRLEIIEDDQHLASVGLKNQGIFHPLKYLFGLVEICKKSGVTFYEHTKVTHIERKNHAFKLIANQHHIQCQYVIHATRYPFIRKGLYFLKLFQEREYIDLKNQQDSKESSLSIDLLKSYRPIQEEQSLFIHRDAKDWFAQDSIPLRGIPYIGRLSRYENEFIIYGFQKWGMTLSQVAATLISDLIMGKNNPYEQLYTCTYFSISSAKRYFHHLLSNNKKGYVSQRFHKRYLPSIENRDGGIVKINGHLRAAYKDQNGDVYLFSPYCPHLKCLIHFDKKSQTWVCPCHQSVFDAYGYIIEGPSLYSLTNKKE